MLKNYLIIGLRNLRRQKGYSFINILGLTIGIGCCLAIAMFVRQEVSYDRHHEHAERIYRLTSRTGISGSGTHFAAAAAPMARVMQDEFPEVLAATRVRPSSAVVRVGDQTFRERRLYFADSSFFEVFTVPLLRGDASKALRAPNALVLTRATAEKYFGPDDPIGRTLMLDGEAFVVSAVAHDPPVTSHFRFELLASLSSLGLPEDAGPEQWISNLVYYTYLRLQDEESAAAVQARLPALVERSAGNLLDRFGATFSLELQPLTRIHLHSDLTSEIEPTGDVAYVYLFSSAAIFILLIACINFINLATARSIDRGREVGMRKVLGAQRLQLMRQFIVETLIFASVAAVLAVLAVVWALPYLRSVTGYPLQLSVLGEAPMIAAIVGVVLAVGLIAGWYPSMVLTGYRPVEVLKGRFRSTPSGGMLRKGLVVVQFAVSIVLLVGTGIVSRQVEYAREQRLGFNSEQVLVASLPESTSRSSALQEMLRGREGVVTVSATDHFPGGPVNDAVHIPEGAADDQGIHFWRYNVDFGFVETLQIPIVAGRSFSLEHPSDSAAFLINETAARAIGWTDPVGKTIYQLPSPNPTVRVPGRVIGVVEDFHFESIRNEIKPLIIAIDPRPEYLIVRLRPEAIDETLALLDDRFEERGAPLEYFFLDARFEALYESEARLGLIFRIFAALAVLVACLGLFALSTYSVQQRTKEIGIRKVLGASVPGITLDLTKGFVSLVLVGFLVAAPVAYVAARMWLQEFAYRISIDADLFLLAGGAAASIAVATISIQSIRAALANPIETLRYE